MRTKAYAEKCNSESNAEAVPEEKTARSLMMMVPDVTDLVELAERVRSQVQALARRYGVSVDLNM